MGTTIPPDPPELNPSANFFVSTIEYIGDCSGTFAASHICVKTGAQINFWYAAGNQCKIFAGLCNPTPGNSEYIFNLLEIP